MKKPALVRINILWLLVFFTPLFAAGIIYFKSNKSIQIEILTMSAIVYVSVAILHHWRDKTLTREIVAEYVLLAVLALIIVLSLLF